MINDYTKFSAKPAEVKPVQPEVKMEPEVEHQEPIVGRVVDCVKLNVRQEPDCEADIICAIPAGTKFEIDEEESTEDFYKICTYSGIEGFCMKDFVLIE